MEKEQLLFTAKKNCGKNFPNDTESIFVTGGESIYHMLLPYCDTAYITRLDYEYQADTWMPNLDKEENWSIVEKSEERYCFDLIYHFTTYKNAVPELH